MKKSPILAAIVLILGSATFAGAAELKEKWRATGFEFPESVSYDAKLDVLYVSNIGGDPTAKDGNGFISKLRPDGTVENLKWATGLDAPKGTEVVGDRLFVTDLNRLVEIDTATGEIVNAYPAEGATFLNDLAVTADGRIFIADTFGNAIYVFENGAVGEWLRDPNLIGPNGLIIDGTYLIVAELGDASQGFDKLKPGTIKKVDLATKEVTVYGTTEAICSLYGIEKSGDGGVLVTDNMAGKVLKVMPGERPTEVGTVKPGAADFEAGPGAVLIIPQMQENAVVEYEKPG